MSGQPTAASDSGARSAAFPKRYRLLKTDDYSSVFGFRRALKSRHFLLHYRPHAASEEGGARLGLVVAKRFLRRSVDRNLVRRLARESFRLVRARLSACDFVLRVAAKPARLERRELAHEIRDLLGRMTTARR
ncbi:MAG: ribonuclease P protein component [Candidatus Accumulibacter sp.]|uniref:ribonuclease P protein component n=1 Tax=Accumulibacter sp. TaxID=2053492 RepID=UPI00287979EE|nr:ribonuclease P protein component [Accumulibacter sp.]MDS4015155.1 ribonuclease P protein component [Accumulibacter sp.]